MVPDHLPDDKLGFPSLMWTSAVLLQRRPYNEYSSSSSSTGGVALSEQGAEQAGPGSQQASLAPLGGILQVDLLSLSAPAKQSHAWTVRQVCVGVMKAAC